MLSAAGHSARMSSARLPLIWLFVPLVAAAAVFIGWTGYIASDDSSYYLGALEWLQRPPFAGDDHWTTRFPLVLTLAAAIAGTGGGDLALGLTALFWYASFIAAGAALAHRIGGTTVTATAALLLATMPLVATSASVVNCDLPEATFLLVGLWLLAPEAATGQRRERSAFASGICFGLAILCRETAILPLAGLGLLFLFGRPVSRKSLLVAAAGAALVLGAEMLFQFALTGDPLHRYVLAFNHDATLDRAADLEGNILVHPLIDPLLVLLINNEFALLFWLAGAALAARFTRHLDAAQRRMLLLPVATGGVAFLLVALLSGKLVLNPRYFTIAAVAAALAVAFWLVRLGPRWRWSILTVAVGVNLLMLSVQNAIPRWPSTALVLAAAAHPGRLVSAEAGIVHRADLPLGWNGVRNAVPAPAAGSLLLIAEDAAPAGAVLARYPSPPTPLGRVMRGLGLAPLIPSVLATRLLRPNPTMVLVDSRFPVGGEARSIGASPGDRT